MGNQSYDVTRGDTREIFKAQSVNLEVERTGNLKINSTIASFII